MESLRKRSGVTNASVTKRIQEIEERNSGVEDSIEIINTTVKDNVKRKKLLVQTYRKSRTQ